MQGEATQLLARLGAGDRDAAEALLPLLYTELRALAERHMSGERRGHTLQPTALVHEAWLRLLGCAPGTGERVFEGRSHFLHSASRIMRQILVDHARQRNALRRSGSGEREPLEGLVLAFEESGQDLVDLDEALRALEAEDPELAELVELRFFGGATMEEAGLATGTSLSTAERRWRIARAWLARRLGAGHGP